MPVVLFETIEPLVPPPIEVVPVTEKLNPPIISVEPSPTVNDVHEAIAATVTVCPDAIITSSPLPGTTPPTQVAVALQFPVPADVIVAANEFTPQTIIISKNNTFIIPLLFPPKNFVKFFIFLSLFLVCYSTY